MTATNPNFAVSAPTKNEVLLQACGKLPRKGVSA